MAASAYLISSAALHPAFGELSLAIVAVRFFGLARGFLRYGERLVSHSVNLRLLARLRVRFYEAIEPLAPARLIHRRSGDLLARAVADIETLQELFVRVLAPPATAVVVAFSLALLLGGTDASLALVVLAAFALAGLAVPAGVVWLTRQAGSEVVHARAELQAQLADGIQGVADLVAAGQELEFASRIRSLSDRLGRAQSRMTWAAGVQSGTSSLVTHLVMLAMLVVAIGLVGEGVLEGVLLASVTLGMVAAMEATAPLPEAALAWESARAAARRLDEIAKLPPPVVDRPAPVALAGPSRLMGISVRGLRFTYEAGDPPALDGIDLEVPAGRRVAVVGPSGAGKSTLVNLIMRFWDYSEGQIRLGGVELRVCAQAEVRRVIGVIPQRCFLFAATIRENLLVAAPDASASHVERAARRAQLHEFIRSLPDGYETWIGERGMQLSGGERQRLAIARALLRDTPVLVLDEPTAHLDAVTERDLLSSVWETMEGRTLLLVTHRLVGMEAMDEIVFLEAGRIVERGSHAELVAARGRYRRMWEAQRGLLAEV
jgi:thiol reductant ABC exporter CydC subunit